MKQEKIGEVKIRRDWWRTVISTI